MTQPAARSGDIPPSERSTPTSTSESIKDVEANVDGSGESRGDDYNDAITPHISNASVGAPITKKETSVRTTATSDPNYEVDYAEGDDQTNPKNWPTWYKGITLAVVSWCTFVTVVYSTSYTTGFPQMEAEFHASEPVVTTGVTTYLVGIAMGSLILAPVSEIYGRRPVFLGSMFAFTVLVIPCAVAKNLATLITVRFFSALAGSAMVSNAPGTISDIMDDQYRALAFSIWSIGPLNGPTFGPIIGGFSTQYLGWRWTNWIVMIMSGAGLVVIFFIQETYPPAILRHKARKRRTETGDQRWWSRYDSKESFSKLLRISLSRPFVMALTEPICIFWDLYVAIVYGILYLCFVAYPIVFSGARGWSIGISGLAFTGIGVGSFLTIGCEPLIRYMINSHRKDTLTGRAPPEAQVSVIIMAAIAIPIGELWFAWTGLPPVHWIWPILAGIPFGAGNTAVFIYATNYLAGSYGIYAASALAGNAVLRSLLGGLLPLAGPAMYATLKAHWAGTLLGLVQVACIPIPIVFYKYGSKIRMKSTLIREMRQEAERLEGKRQRRLEHLLREKGNILEDEGDVEKGLEHQTSKRDGKELPAQTQVMVEDKELKE